MKTDSPNTTSIPGIAPSIFRLVKEEGLRWRQAASANDWAVLTPPPARPYQAEESPELPVDGLPH